MCSVVGCDSWRRSAQRFKLPEDPEKRLEWVQFLAEVNGQGFKESSWTDITICIEHFANDCYESLTDTVQLKPGAVPSLCVKSEPQEPDPDHANIKSEVKESSKSLQEPDPDHANIKTEVKETSKSLQEPDPDHANIKSEVRESSKSLQEPDPDHANIKSEELLETTEESYQCFEIKTCDSPAEYSEETSAPAAAQGSPVPNDLSCSADTPETSAPAAAQGSPAPSDFSCSADTSKTSAPAAAQGSPAPSDISCSADTSDAGMYDYGQMLQKVKNLDIIREKAALLQKKGQYVVNENRLLKLFNLKCPLCGSEVKVEKFTQGIFLILNQTCLQCDYRNQWKSQADVSVSTAHLTGGMDVTLEIQQEVSADDNHSSITGDSMDESDSSDEDDMNSDEEWNPDSDVSLVEELLSESEDNENVHDEYLPPRHSQLCTDCGVFFNKLKPHSCEHKIKPYSCNICGKRCVSEVALNSHSRIHDDNYEHRCKYCNVPFKTKLDKITHEQIHISEEKPYKCPECSKTFATNKQRKVHLKVHGGPKVFKCNICGIEFVSHLNLQRHEVVHSGLKPYKCSVCQRGFNQPGHLKSHMRLHTGERPFKCQHCDKSFNHNVSLKSHVQRYHASKTGCQQKKRKNKRACDSGDAQENGDKRGSDLEHDSVKDNYTDSEVWDDPVGIPKKKWKKRSTGRPIGRPKSSATGSIVQTGDRSSNTKNAKVKPQKLKRSHYSDEASEDQETDSEMSFDPEEEEEEVEVKSKRKRKSTNSDRDSDFDPEDRKKMSSHKTGKSSGKRRGRQGRKELSDMEA